MQAVLDYLKKNQSRFIGELCEYVRFPSVSAQPEHKQDLQRCAEWVLKHCRGIGLEARLCPTKANPIIVAKTPRGGSSSPLPSLPKQERRKNRPSTGDRPHFVIYGHYDVQPPEPFELWKSPPFEPRIVGRSIFARGSTDNKGQHLAHLNAVEAYLKTGTELPCDLVFVVEGEEEVGSQHLGPFLKRHVKELACDAVVI